MDFRKLYLDYKKKYLNLKTSSGGGCGTCSNQKTKCPTHQGGNYGDGTLVPYQDGLQSMDQTGLYQDGMQSMGQTDPYQVGMPVMDEPRYDGYVNDQFRTGRSLSPRYGYAGRVSPRYGSTGRLSPRYGSPGRLSPRYGSTGRLSPGRLPRGDFARRGDSLVVLASLFNSPYEYGGNIFNNMLDFQRFSKDTGLDVSVLNVCFLENPSSPKLILRNDEIARHLLEMYSFELDELSVRLDRQGIPLGRSLEDVVDNLLPIFHRTFMLLYQVAGVMDKFGQYTLNDQDLENVLQKYDYLMTEYLQIQYLWRQPLMSTMPRTTIYEGDLQLDGAFSDDGLYFDANAVRRARSRSRSGSRGRFYGMRRSPYGSPMRGRSLYGSPMRGRSPYGSPMRRRSRSRSGSFWGRRSGSRSRSPYATQPYLNDQYDDPTLTSPVQLDGYADYSGQPGYGLSDTSSVSWGRRGSRRGSRRRSRWGFGSRNRNRRYSRSRSRSRSGSRRRW